MICNGCKTEKSSNNFYKGRTKCKDCMNSVRRKKYKTNKDVINNDRRVKYKDNDELRIKIINAQTEYTKKNKEKVQKYQKKYRQENAEFRLEYSKKYNKERRKKDICFALRESITAQINRVLDKGGESCLKYLPYNLQELKQWLEDQFEDWMTWENHGRYMIDSWDDNNKTTWTWQIDHIVPHSNFKYSSMQDPKFLECWDLKNLRPISAKENLIKRDKILVIPISVDI